MSQLYLLLVFVMAEGDMLTNDYYVIISRQVSSLLVVVFVMGLTDSTTMCPILKLSFLSYLSVITFLIH